jgi:hypothetical protein
MSAHSTQGNSKPLIQIKHFFIGGHEIFIMLNMGCVGSFSS